MGPGDRKMRRTRSRGTARSPPKGGFAFWSSTRVALGVTGSLERSSTLRMSAGEAPALRNRSAIAGACSKAWATVPASRAPCSRRCSSQLFRSCVSSRYPLVRSILPPRRPPVLREPPLASLVVLGVLERALRPLFSDPQVELLHVWVLPEFLAGS